MHQKILSTLIKIYLKPFDDIQLHRDMIGYVCKISSGKTKFILKLFRSNHTDQALQSIKVMKYLYEEGYPTPNIIPTASGEPYFDFADQEEKRIGVLYEYIEGAEPDKDKDIEDLGRQTGRLHSLMQQYPADLYYHTKPFFIDRYINLLYKMNYPKVDQFIEYGNELWKRVEGLPQGFCHGDYHTGNMLKDTKGRYVLFDFDAAANAFSLFDIAVICDMTDYFTPEDQMYDETTRMLERFLKGYREYKSISEEEILSIYDFIAIRHYECQATVIENLGLSCVDEEFIDAQFAWLMQWEKLMRG